MAPKARKGNNMNRLKIGNAVKSILTPFSGRGNTRGSSQAGMTLIEIVVVLALIGGLMGIIIGNITAGTNTAKIRETQLAFGQLRSSLQMYKLAMNKFPTTEQGLRVLVENPGISGWRGPYCEPEILNDAWAQEIQYESDGRALKFMSMGDDGQFGTDDDIVWPEAKKVAAQ